jgi:hypothetical protein
VSHVFWKMFTNVSQESPHSYSDWKIEAINSTETSINKYHIVGFEIFTGVVMKSSISWDIISCSPLKVNWRFRETFRLLLQEFSLSSIFMLVTCLAFSSILKMKEICSSETSVDFQRTTRQCMPGNTALILSDYM